jgi:hypothetical protein
MKMMISQKNVLPKTHFPGIGFSNFWCQKTPQNEGYSLVYKFHYLIFKNILTPRLIGTTLFIWNSRVQQYDRLAACTCSRGEQ